MSDLRAMIPWKGRDEDMGLGSRDGSAGFPAMRAVLGEALLAAGASATADALAARLRPTREEGMRPLPHDEDEDELPLRMLADWAGVGLGSLAGAVQIAQALEPSPYRRGAAAILSGLVAGTGTVAFIESVRGTVTGRRPPSLPYLVFSSLGILGLLVDRAETAARSHGARSRPARQRAERIVIRI